MNKEQREKLKENIIKIFDHDEDPLGEGGFIHTNEWLADEILQEVEKVQ